MELVALLSSGKGTWSQVIGLVNRGEWDKIIFIGNSFSKQSISKFTFNKEYEFITIDFDASIKEIISEIKKKLRDKIKGMEVALSIASGDGREHMALISALIQLPVGIKFVALTRDGIIEF